MIMKISFCLPFLLAITTALAAKSAKSPAAIADAKFPKESRKIYKQLMNNIAKPGEMSYKTADSILSEAEQLSKYIGAEQLGQVARSVSSHLSSFTGSSASQVKKFFLDNQSRDPKNFRLLAEEARKKLQQSQLKNQNHRGSSNRKQIITPDIQKKFAGLFDSPKEQLKFSEAAKSLNNIVNKIIESTSSAVKPEDKTAKIAESVGGFANFLDTVIPDTNKTAKAKSLLDSVGGVVTGINAFNKKDTTSADKINSVVNIAENIFGFFGHKSDDKPKESNKAKNDDNIEKPKNGDTTTSNSNTNKAKDTANTVGGVVKGLSGVVDAVNNKNATGVEKTVNVIGNLFQLFQRSGHKDGVQQEARDADKAQDTTVTTNVTPSPTKTKDVPSSVDTVVKGLSGVAKAVNDNNTTGVEKTINVIGNIFKFFQSSAHKDGGQHGAQGASATTKVTPNLTKTTDIPNPIKDIPNSVGGVMKGIADAVNKNNTTGVEKAVNFFGELFGGLSKSPAHKEDDKSNAGEEAQKNATSTPNLINNVTSTTINKTKDIANAVKDVSEVFSNKNATVIDKGAGVANVVGGLLNLFNGNSAHKEEAKEEIQQNVSTVTPNLVNNVTPKAAKDIASTLKGASEAFSNKNASVIDKAAGVANVVGNLFSLFNGNSAHTNDPKSTQTATATVKPKTLNFWDLFG